MDNINIAPEKKKKSNYSCAYIASSMLLVILVSAITGTFFGFLSGGFGQTVFTRISQEFPSLFNHQEKISPAVSREKIIQEDSAIIDVVEKSTLAVVSIVVSKDMPKVQKFFDPFGFFDNAPDQDNSPGNMKKEKIGAGTGFIITSDGMIATNKHVVSDATAEYTVVTSDGKEHIAKVLARDPLIDVAVIKIEGTDYSTLSFGNSESLKIGQTAVAIGNSLGEFSNTVSKGIISGLKRTLIAGNGFNDSEKLTNIIQTDAAINPGNSGGPLLDINGKVIGINVAIAQGAQNVGFAIPANQVLKTTEQVRNTGKISTPYLGVRYIPVDDILQKKINLAFNYGVMVLRGQEMTDFAVIPGSPADKAGIVENDIILEINGQKIDTTNVLIELLAKFKVGDEIVLKIWHKGSIKEVKVKLEERI